MLTALSVAPDIFSSSSCSSISSSGCCVSRRQHVDSAECRSRLLHD